MWLEIGDARTRFPFFRRNSGLALAMVLLLLPDNEMALAPASISMIFEQFYFMFMMWFYEKRVPPEESEC